MCVEIDVRTGGVSRVCSTLGELASALGVEITALTTFDAADPLDGRCCLCNVSTAELEALGARRATSEEIDDDPFVSWVIEREAVPA